MRRVIDLMMMLSLAGCAAQPASYVSGPIVPDAPAMLRHPAAATTHVVAPPQPSAPGVDGRLDAINRNVQTLRAWLANDRPN